MRVEVKATAQEERTAQKPCLPHCQRAQQPAQDTVVAGLGFLLFALACYKKQQIQEAKCPVVVVHVVDIMRPSQVTEKSMAVAPERSIRL